jgi:predicted porin
MEFGVNVGDGFGGKSGGFWSQRNAYVGLAGDWGTLVAGRHDTPHKLSTGKLDFFADTAADYDASGAKGVDFFDDLRVDGTIAYISPNWSGFNFSGAIVQTGTDVNANPDSDDGLSAYSLAAQYSNGPWFAAAAYESLDGESLNAAPTGAPDDTKWRVGLGILGFSGFSASAVYEDRSDAGFVDGSDSQAWQLQAAYDFGNNRVKGMYGQFDDDSAGDSGDFDAWAIGLQHNMSKRTDVQILYRQKGYDDIDNDDDVFALQLDHAF